MMMLRRCNSWLKVMLEKLTGGRRLGKGGARKASADFAVAKGMSLQDHYNALLFASLNTTPPKNNI